MSFELKTKRFWRSQLPHWEVEAGFYFFTVRCAGTLPRVVSQQLKETQQALAQIRANSADFEILQRRYFQTVEKYSDSHQGFCPFRNNPCAKQLSESLIDLAQFGWEVPYFVIMPNHVHVLVKPWEDTDLPKILHSWKSYTVREINKPDKIYKKIVSV